MPLARGQHRLSLAPQRTHAPSRWLDPWLTPTPEISAVSPFERTPSQHANPTPEKLRRAAPGALLTLDALRALPQVSWREEPPGIFEKWRSLATLETASPKVWMDAYLAAFAIQSRLRLVTLDRDFKKFEPQGFDLVLLNP